MMAFGDHLEELRRRLLFALAPIIPVFVLLFLGCLLYTSDAADES